MWKRGQRKCLARFTSEVLVFDFSCASRVFLRVLQFLHSLKSTPIFIYAVKLGLGSVFPPIADTLVINYNKWKRNLFTDPPENVRLTLTRSGQSATITCTAKARPEPSYKIFLNETTLVISDKTYTIPEVNSSHVGYYKCVAENVIEQRFSNPICLCLEGKITFLFASLICSLIYLIMFCLIKF